MKKIFEIEYLENTSFDLLAKALVSQNNLYIDEKNRLKQNLQISRKAIYDVSFELIKYLCEKLKPFGIVHNSLSPCDLGGTKYCISAMMGNTYSIVFYVSGKLDEYNQIDKFIYSYISVNGCKRESKKFDIKDIESVLLKHINLFDMYHKRKNGLI